MLMCPPAVQFILLCFVVLILSDLSLDWFMAETDCDPETCFAVSYSRVSPDGNGDGEVVRARSTQSTPLPLSPPSSPMKAR